MTPFEALHQARVALKNRGIGRRLLLAIILFSSLVTLIATAVQLYTDYRRDLNQIKSRLTDIENSYLASLGASLWNLDIDQLRLQLEGIRQLPDIQAVAVTETNQNVSTPLHIKLGDWREKQTISRTYPIEHQVGSESRTIGTLVVQASLTEVYNRLWEKAMVILFSQGVKTFLVSSFILYIFYHFVTTHLAKIAHHVSQYELTRPPPPLRLERDQPSKPDELDQVVSAFNTLSDNLSQAFEHMREVNITLAQDIIARREAEEEVKRLNAILEERVRQRTAELEAANKELASFCYSVSHDLRAPLRRIEGFRRLLSDELNAQSSTDMQHYLSRIETGTRDMADMIDSFLRLSRTTQGELSVESVNLSELVARLYKEFSERDPERLVKLDLEPQVWAQVDRRFFEMLLSNLLSNAWKYSSQVNPAKILFGTRWHEGQKQYFVTDNGAGFDMKYADRLFAPFSRLHKTEEFEGIGIGLATVQRIIGRHGGRVWADAEPGKGAAFFFTLWERSQGSEQGNNITGGGQSG